MQSHPASPTSGPASPPIRSRVSRLFTFATLACAVGLSSVDARNWYVSPTGVDTNNSVGDDENPFATIQKAHDLTNPGDTVFIMQGTYAGFNITRGGTSDSTRITYKNGSATRPLIRFTGYTGISIENGAPGTPATAYVTLDGLRVQGNTADLTRNPNGITSEAAWAAYYRRLNGGAYEGNFNGHGILIKGAETKVVHHIDVRNCEVFLAPSSGIAALYADYLKIEDNDVHENCFYNYDGTSGLNMWHLKSYDNAAGVTTYIRRNKSWGNWSYIPWLEKKKVTDGNGLILDFLDQTNYSGKVRVENNLFYRNGGRGINLTDSSGMIIVHNTSYNNGKSEFIGSEFVIGTDSDQTQLANNIFVNTNGEKLLGADPDCTGATFTNNIFWNGTNGGVRDRTSTTDIVGDPKFKNVANNGSDFHLTSASTPAINAASSTLTTVDHDNYPRGGNRDIGAYEFH